MDEMMKAKARLEKGTNARYNPNERTKDFSFFL